jgi:sugar phosphate permease
VSPARHARIYYGWIVAAVTLVALLVTAGSRSLTSLLIHPLEDDFGWSRGAISLAITLNLVTFGLVAPFSTALMERIGVRRVMVGALAAIGAATALTAAVNQLWQLELLWGIVLGLATGSISVPLAALVASRWFVQRRGLVTGFLTASYATGQLIFLPILAVVLATAGWRFATGTVAIVTVALVVPLVVLFVRDRPEQIGLLPYGAPAGPVKVPERSASGAFSTALSGLRLGARTPVFWLLTGSFFICGATTVGLVGTHLIPAARDEGMDEVSAASLLAAIGIFDVLGTIASGYLTDRFDSRRLLAWFYALRGLSLFALPAALATPEYGMAPFVIVFGLDFVATVPPTVALTAQAFGSERVGVVFAWIFASHQIGGAVAAGLAGGVRDWTDNYTGAFVGGGILCLLAAALVLRIRAGGPGVLEPRPVAS